MSSAIMCFAIVLVVAAILIMNCDAEEDPTGEQDAKEERVMKRIKKFFKNIFSSSKKTEKPPQKKPDVPPISPYDTHPMAPPLRPVQLYDTPMASPVIDTGRKSNLFPEESKTECGIWKDDATIAGWIVEFISTTTDGVDVRVYGTLISSAIILTNSQIKVEKKADYRVEFLFLETGQEIWQGTVKSIQVKNEFVHVITLAQAVDFTIHKDFRPASLPDDNYEPVLNPDDMHYVLTFLDNNDQSEIEYETGPEKLIFSKILPFLMTGTTIKQTLHLEKHFKIAPGAPIVHKTAKNTYALTAIVTSVSKPIKKSGPHIKKGQEYENTFEIVMISKLAYQHYL